MRLSNARMLLPWAPLALRLSLGVIFLAHGAQKLFGIWEGPGLPATIDMFNTHFGIPTYLLLVSVATEFLGGIAVTIGLLTRLASVGLAIDMAVAIIKVNWPSGFFLNWYMVPGRGHGYEFSLALMAMSIALALSGPGKLAVDNVLGFEEE
jgi:putative oxidoreductase